jgi:hypothetical protein
LGVWQDANTLRKRPVFKTASDIKTAGDSVNMDKSEDEDVQVIKVVDSHSDEILRSGNTSEYFFFFSST